MEWLVCIEVNGYFGERRALGGGFPANALVRPVQFDTEDQRCLTMARAVSEQSPKALVSKV